MGDKVLISLQVPAVEQRFDVFVPEFLTVREAAKLLAEGVMDLTRQQYVVSGTEMLCRRKPVPVVLRPDALISDYGLREGEELYLI